MKDIINKKVNLSGSAKIDFDLEVNSFIQGVEKTCIVNKFNSGSKMDSEGKFKLGLYEREFNITFEHEGEPVEVLVYLKLSTNNKNVREIETFTGVDYLIDVRGYHEKLSRALGKSSENQVDLKLSFNGYVK